jgi:hypothetical protein
LRKRLYVKVDDAGLAELRGDFAGSANEGSALRIRVARRGDLQWIAEEAATVPGKRYVVQRLAGGTGLNDQHGW